MEAPDPDIEILRSMSAERKLAVMHALIRQAYDLKAAWVRARWPDLPDEEVRARARAAVAGERA